MGIGFKGQKEQEKEIDKEEDKTHDIVEVSRKIESILKKADLRYRDIRKEMVVEIETIDNVHAHLEDAEKKFGYVESLMQEREKLIEIIKSERKKPASKFDSNNFYSTLHKAGEVDGRLWHLFYYIEKILDELVLKKTHELFRDDTLRHELKKADRSARKLKVKVKKTIDRFEETSNDMQKIENNQKLIDNRKRRAVVKGFRPQ